MIPSAVAREARENLLDYLQTTYGLKDERLESALEFLREFEDDVRRTERVPVVVVEPSAAAVLREFGVEPEDLGVDRLVEAELREGCR